MMHKRKEVESCLSAIIAAQHSSFAPPLGKEGVEHLHQGKFFGIWKHSILLQRASSGTDPDVMEHDQHQWPCGVKY